jgi:hypothetical protein
MKKNKVYQNNVNQADALAMEGWLANALDDQFSDVSMVLIKMFLTRFLQRKRASGGAKR